MDKAKIYNIVKRELTKYNIKEKGKHINEITDNISDNFDMYISEWISQHIETLLENE